MARTRAWTAEYPETLPPTMLLPFTCHSIKHVTHGVVKPAVCQGFHTLSFLLGLLHDASALILCLGLGLSYQATSFSLGVGPSFLKEGLCLLFSLDRQLLGLAYRRVVDGPSPFFDPQYLFDVLFVQTLIPLSCSLRNELSVSPKPGPLGSQFPAPILSADRLQQR
jgi:hypothetical protein